MTISHPELEIFGETIILFYDLTRFPLQEDRIFGPWKGGLSYTR